MKFALYTALFISNIAQIYVVEGRCLFPVSCQLTVMGVGCVCGVREVRAGGEGRLAAAVFTLHVQTKADLVAASVEVLALDKR